MAGPKQELLRPPIVKPVDHSRTNIDTYLTTTLNRVMTRVNSTGLTDPVRPYFAINFDWSAMSSVVVSNYKISLSILGRFKRAS